VLPETSVPWEVDIASDSWAVVPESLSEESAIVLWE